MTTPLAFARVFSRAGQSPAVAYVEPASWQDSDRLPEVKIAMTIRGQLIATGLGMSVGEKDSGQDKTLETARGLTSEQKWNMAQIVLKNIEDSTIELISKGMREAIDKSLPMLAILEQARSMMGEPVDQPLVRCLQSPEGHQLVLSKDVDVNTKTALLRVFSREFETVLRFSSPEARDAAFVSDRSLRELLPEAQQQCLPPSPRTPKP